MKYVYEYVYAYSTYTNVCGMSECNTTSAARNQIANVIVHLRKGRIAFVRALASPRTANARNCGASLAHRCQ